MVQHLVMGLYVEKDLIPISFEDFKKKMNQKIVEQLKRWKNDPLNKMKSFRYEEKEYKSYFEEVLRFRSFFYSRLLDIFEIKETEFKGYQVYMICFDINRLTYDDGKEKLGEPLMKSFTFLGMKSFDVVQSLNEILVNIKSSFYFDNLEYLFDKKESLLNKEHANWTQVVKNLKKLNDQVEVLST